MNPVSPSKRDALVPCVQAFVFALYPFFLVLSLSKDVPLHPPAVVRAAAASVLVAAFALWALRFLHWNLAARATWFSWVFALFGFYVPLAMVGRSLVPGAQLGDGLFALVYALFSLALVTIFVRPWQNRRRDALPLTITAAAMMAFSLYPRANAFFTGKTAEGVELGRRLAEAAAGGSDQAHADRDVYYIVLDALGQSDVLDEYYHESLDSFAEHLTSRGFYVAEHARSNYAQTFLSLSSTLNMTYLDEVAAAMGPDSADRRPLHQLIQHNALMQLAKKAGYRVIAIGSDYLATKEVAGADVCYCRHYGLHAFEQAVLAVTPIAALPLRGWTYAAHRRKVLSSLDAIEAASNLPGPKFVFAHIVSPHPPFVLGEDGSFDPVFAGPVLFNDGDAYLGDASAYKAGYRRQVRYLTTRLRTIVDRLLARNGPRPVIVIHGDHGPGSGLRWEDPQATDLRERMGIFAAYHFPDDNDDDDADKDADEQEDLYATISPLNAARILSNAYLGANFELLPDQSYFSTWSRPFDLIPASPPGQ